MKQWKFCLFSGGQKDVADDSNADWLIEFR
jgi:hypothetical protein